MQQPQSRPLLGDSVSSTTAQGARRNNPVAVLTHQQLQQLQQLQAQSTGGQSLTFALQQATTNPQDQGNASTTGNHIVYVNQLNQLNQSTINPAGTGMGLPPATPTFGVGLNMGLPLSLLNTNLTSLTSNVITTSNPLLNLGLPNINTGLTALNSGLNTLNTVNSNNINNGLSGLGQDLNTLNSGINRLNTINSTNLSSGLSNVNPGLTNVNSTLTSLNSSINQNLTNINSNSGLTTINANLNTNLSTTSVNTNINQGINNRPVNALATGLTPTSLNTSSAQFPFQTIQSITPQIVGSSIAHVPISSTAQHSNQGATVSISNISSAGNLTSSNFTSSCNDTMHVTTANINPSVNLSTPHVNAMHSNLSNLPSSHVHMPTSSETITVNQITSLNSSQAGFQTQRQFSQTSGINSSASNQGSNTVNTMNSVKTVQNIQNQSISSPGSPFSMPLKSPASNIAPPTPSPSPNRLLLRSPANSIQSNRNSPSPVGTTNVNSSFSIPMQSPLQSPVLSPYPPAKSPHLLSGNNSLNNRSPAPGGSPGPPVVRPSTPIVQSGMQVLQIIGTPQGYQSTPAPLVTRTHLFGNQQIQIATAKPTKQPPQILPKPPNQQSNNSQQKPQRATTTITNQVTQQTQPQLVLAGPQPTPNTTTMIPTAQGLLLNQVLPSNGPVIVQQQPGGVQLILRTPANAQQQSHTTQLTQQQLVRVVAAQGMQLQGITPTFFAVPNGFPSTASPVIRHTPSSPAPSNTNAGNSIVIQNAVVQSPQPQITQVNPGNTTSSITTPINNTEQNLLPPPKKKAKKKKKTKRKEDEAPKLDLASIMKISGIGDDDDIFDSDIITETDASCQVEQEGNSMQQTISQALPTQTVTTSVPNLIQVPAQNTTNPQVTTPQNFSSQLVTQLQMPVQNAISGQLRLAVGEDGRVVLHHTPEPNQPEIDQATAQALIRSLTQSNGQNAPVISQLFGSTQTTVQTSQQNNLPNRQKFVKSPSSSTNLMNVNSSTQNTISINNTHLTQASQKPTIIQRNINVSDSNIIQNIGISNSMGNLPNMTHKNIKVHNIVHTMKNGQPSSIISTEDGVHVGIDNLTSKNACATFTVQGPRMCAPGQNVNQNLTLLAHKPEQQPRFAVNRINTTTRLPSNKNQNINQKTQMNSINENQIKADIHQQIQKDTTGLQESSMFQHNHKQQTTKTLHVQNAQQIFDQSIQTGQMTQHNTMSVLQQQGSCNTVQRNDLNLKQHSAVQQSTMNIVHQNTNISNPEQMLHSGLADSIHAQQNVVTSMQQQNTSAVIHNTSVQQNVNVQQQKVIAANTFSSINAQQFETTNPPNNVQGVNLQNNQHQNIVIANCTPSSSSIHQNEIPKPEMTATNNILNNAPKITPEILNALSNLNPNDQLLIANANGQMQVISQQLLQQFLTGQLQQQNQAQNQTQKIVIGEPDTNNQNLQGVQINTPTSQIIVNSSGGAPTIQNNIQNIVVQAAPSQIPQQIQIQNSTFPSQFIDNLNQHQIRNLGSNQPTKKAKIVKRTKTAVTIAQNIGNIQASKNVIVSRPNTAITTNESSTQKLDSTNKIDSLAQVTHQTNPVKVETRVGENGPAVTPTVTSQPIQSTQMVQRVQTIQLPAQKQQQLKSIQSQIQAILNRKPTTQLDQTTLAKLYQEQGKILASGKIVNTTTQSVASSAETSIGSNVVSTAASNSQLQNLYKNQIAAVQTQTQTTTSLPVSAQQLNTGLATVSNVPHNTTGYITNITVHQNAQMQTCTSNTSSQILHQIHTKQQQQQQQQHLQQQQQQPQMFQKSSNQTQVPSSSVQTFTAPNIPVMQIQTSVGQLTVPHIQQQQQQPTSMQQSTQCQTDPVDVKPNVQIQSPVKQELTSPIQVQVHAGSPAGQVASPRMLAKGVQRIQSPVNNSNSSSTTIKQIGSPGDNSSPLISPRQGIKRPASSPICRQINRSDLLEQQLKIDQNGATNPDVNTPFLDKRDACKRLVKYHCLNEQVLSTKDLAKADEIFEETAKHLLSKFNSMMNKYTYLLLMESMREVRTSELMMIDRTFVAEEQNILNKLREQEARISEEFKKEEKPVVPKIEQDYIDDDKMSVPLTNVSVKRELEDDFTSNELDCKPIVKSASAASGDYDEWLEIQKELGVYPSEPMKCRTGMSSSTSSCSISAPRTSTSYQHQQIPAKPERTRANGEFRPSATNSSIPGVSNSNLRDNCETDVGVGVFEKRWSTATELERDLLEDTDSLDGLALNSQTQCPTSLHLNTDNTNCNEHDDITAQVQSAIDSILNLKKRPANQLANTSGSTLQTGETKDSVLDQAVRSILGS